ncbi:MAG: hypothetical protein CMC75_10680 [Flavobacteriaceae bacterium]|nr:hypothetical protein [Flavobacteriaceae bacterium]
MKNFLLSATFLLIAFVGFGQCPGNSITFSTQAEIDNFAINFPNCTVVQETLEISGNNISDLSGLSQITTVENVLTIHNNPILQNLNGLEDIQLGTSSSPTIFVFENGSLTNLDGLNGITSNVDPQGIDQIIIRDNPELTSIEGLSSLATNVGKIEIINNNSLTALIGFENLTLIGAIFIENNDLLSQLFTINTSVGTLFELHIVNNEILTNLNGLEALTDLDIQLNIDGNPSLLNLNGLRGVLNDGPHSIPLEFKINNNTSLNDISGFENIDFNTLWRGEITNNTNLSECDIQSICNFIDTSNELIIENNAVRCTSVSEVETECTLVNISDTNFLNAVLNHNPVIDTNNDDLIQFDEAEAFAGTLEVAEKTITDFTGLEAFVNITGFNGGGNFSDFLSLQNNTMLNSVDFSGSPDLEAVNLKNGNNMGITNFNAVDCPSLEFICVDDVAFAETNFTNIDPQVQFVDDCEFLSVPAFNLEEAVTVFPNPVSETLTISITSTFNYIKSEIYSVSGQKLQESANKQIEMGDLSAGIYFVKVISEEGTITKKIVKQ